MHRFHKTIWLYIFGLTLVCLHSLAQDDIETDIDEFIEQVMSCGDIPGFTLALVKDGEDFYSKGYGIMDTESETPVTNETLFIINSCTKAFAGVSLAILLKQNPGIDWLMPVKEILGEDFYLNDTVRTQLVNIVDTLAHRCGTASNNEIRLSGYSLQELVRRLQYLDYPYDFRDGFNYNNIMYGIPSLITEILAEKPWTEFVDKEIFQPLEMNSSTFATNRDVWPNIALPHMPDRNAGNQLRIVSLEVANAYYEIIQAVGAIVTNSLDMAKWIKFQLNRGTTESGMEVLTPAEFRGTVSSRVHVWGEAIYRKPITPVMYAAPSRYALGWQLSNYRDYVMHQHSGSHAGTNSRVSYLPHAGHGMFMAMNKSPVGNIRDLVAMYLYDLLLGVEPWLTKETVCDYIVGDGEETDETDPVWSQYDTTSAQKDQASRAEYTSSKMDGKVHRKPLSDFTGTYGHHAYGNVTVDEDTESGDLFLIYGRDNWTWDLVQDDTDPTKFYATGREPLWYYTMEVDFEREADGIPAHSVVVGFDNTIPPRFDRDLDFSNPPPPPQQCG